MPSYSLFQLESRQALAAHASAWNRLWAGSAATLPTMRAELLSHWLAAFAPYQTFRALVVTEGDCWLAALPLVSGRFKGVLPAGVSTSNDWGLSFDLLLDETCDGPAALTELARGLTELPWGFLSLHHALLDEPRWRHFRTACDEAGIPSDWRPQLQIARVPITGDWNAYRASWSKSHRRHLEKYERALAALGPVTVEWHEQIAAADVERLLARGLALEQRGWKGRENASLAQDAQAWTYLHAQAHSLAAAGLLRVAFLKVGERDVAFEYGWLSQGVYYSFKVAFDDSLAHASPSHVLTARLLEKFWMERGEGSEGVQGSGFRVQEDANCPSHLPSPFALHTSPFFFDFLSPPSPAVLHWRPETYTVGRVLLAPRSLTGALAIRAQRALAPALGN